MVKEQVNPFAAFFALLKGTFRSPIESSSTPLNQQEQPPPDSGAETACSVVQSDGNVHSLCRGDDNDALLTAGEFAPINACDQVELTQTDTQTHDPHYEQFNASRQGSVSVHQSDLARLLILFEEHFAEHGSYVVVGDTSSVGREALRFLTVIKDNKDLFFFPSKRRVVLTGWVLRKIRDLFTVTGKDEVSLEQALVTLRSAFRTHAFSLSRLQHLFGQQDCISIDALMELEHTAFRALVATQTFTPTNDKSNLPNACNPKCIALLCTAVTGSLSIHDAASRLQQSCNISHAFAAGLLLSSPYIGLDSHFTPFFDYAGQAFEQGAEMQIRRIYLLVHMNILTDHALEKLFPSQYAGHSARTTTVTDDRSGRTNACNPQCVSLLRTAVTDARSIHDAASRLQQWSGISQNYATALILTSQHIGFDAQFVPAFDEEGKAFEQGTETQIRRVYALLHTNVLTDANLDTAFPSVDPSPAEPLSFTPLEAPARTRAWPIDRLYAWDVPLWLVDLLKAKNIPTIGALATPVGRAAIDAVVSELLGDERNATRIADALAKLQAAYRGMATTTRWEVLEHLLRRDLEQRARCLMFRAQGGTLEDAGKILGVTRERVRQIESKAQDRLCTWLRKNGQAFATRTQVWPHLIDERLARALFGDEGWIVFLHLLRKQQTDDWHFLAGPNLLLYRVGDWFIARLGQAQVDLVRAEDTRAYLRDLERELVHREFHFITAAMIHAHFQHQGKRHQRPSEQLAQKPSSPVENQAVFAPEVMGAVMGVLMAHFPHGFKVDSPIELMRFRNFAAKTPDCDIRLCDETLKSAIVACGTLFEGKVYVVNEETGRRLRDVIDTEFASGAEVIYYAPVYARHENWLMSGSVVSGEMLKKLLNTLYPPPAYRHRDNYFLAERHDRNESAIIRDEILRIWGDATLRDYAQISARLPYIPIPKVKYALAQNSDFIWNSPEVYTHIGVIDIAEEDRSRIRAYVAKTCQSVGYASITDIPLGDIKEHDRELTLTAIHKAVFVSVLADSYDIRDKILTRKGDTRSALALLKEYCRTVDKCSLQDLVEIKHKLTGERHPTRALEAGHAVLVRIGVDAFVAERRITFDIQRTDDALEFLVTGNYLPLKSITTFAAFPYCGQVWNLFLLESYCRRFSHRFRFDVLACNSQNVGAIIRRSCLLSYAEIMEDAVARADLELDVPNALAFLCDSGYLGKRSYTKIGELIQRAKDIRERQA